MSDREIQVRGGGEHRSDDERGADRRQPVSVERRRRHVRRVHIRRTWRVRRRHRLRRLPRVMPSPLFPSLGTIAYTLHRRGISPLWHSHRLGLLKNDCQVILCRLQCEISKFFDFWNNKMHQNHIWNHTFPDQTPSLAEMTPLPLKSSIIPLQYWEILRCLANVKCTNLRELVHITDYYI